MAGLCELLTIYFSYLFGCNFSVYAVQESFAKVKKNLLWKICEVKLRCIMKSYLECRNKKKKKKKGMLGRS